VIQRVHSFSTLHRTCGGIIFNSTTIAMPKVFDERLAALTQTNFGIGALVALVYTMAAFAQVVMGALIDRMELRRGGPWESDPAVFASKLDWYQWMNQ